MNFLLASICVALSLVIAEATSLPRLIVENFLIFLIIYLKLIILKIQHQIA